jgi:hypothetical protein
MPSYLDLAVLGIVLVSALLSMMRGSPARFLPSPVGRRRLSAYYFYPMVACTSSLYP